MVRVKRKEMLKLRRIIQDIFPNNSPWTRKELSRLDRKELTSFIPSSLMKSVECTGKDGRILKKDMLEFILANAEKIKNEAFVPKILTPSLLEIGGLDSVVAELNERVWFPLMTAPDAAKRLGITPPNGILLHGPPGCGKSLVAVSLANLLSPDEPPVIVKGPEILDSYWGASEKNIRDLFGLDTENDQPLFGLDPMDQLALELTELGGRRRDVDSKKEMDSFDELDSESLRVVVLDEADAILEKRGGKHNKHSDLVAAQFLSCMDGAATRQKEKAPNEPHKHVLMIATTNHVDAVDPAFLRPGRFEVNLEFPLPFPVEREEILKVKTSSLRDEYPESPAIDESAENFLRECAMKTTGFSGADLHGLVRVAKMKALIRHLQEADDLNKVQVKLQRKDLEQALSEELERRR